MHTRQLRGSIAACAQPAAATAAGAINRGWLQLLAAALFAAALSLVLAPPTHAEGLEEPGCQPWICRPSTAGTAVLEGRIGPPEPNVHIDPAKARFVYRTVDYSREADGTYAEPRFGTPHVVKLTEAEEGGETYGKFKVTLPACSPAARVFGCVGGEYEGYATYNGALCSEYNVYILMTVGEVNQVPKSSLACTPPKPSKPKHKKGKQAKHRR